MLRDDSRAPLLWSLSLRWPFRAETRMS